MQRPAILAERHPDEITILFNRAFVWPLFYPQDLASILRSTTELVGEQTLATRLWENKAWRKYLELLTPGKIRRDQNNFDRWARPMVADLDDDFGSPTTQQYLHNFFGRLDDARVELSVRLPNVPRSTCDQALRAGEIV